MSDGKERVTRIQMLDIIDHRWSRYLDAFTELDEKAQAQYLQAQGYQSIKDLLSHINEWWTAALTAIATSRRGERYHRDWASVDEFNARAIERRRDLSPEQITQEFNQLRGALRDLVANVSDEEMESRFVYQWLYGTIYEHWQEHGLINGLS